MWCQEVQLIKAPPSLWYVQYPSSTSLFLSYPCSLLLFTHQYRLDMLTTSSICTKLEGEQDCSPQPHRSFDNDGDYLNILQKFTRYPDYYDHGPSATIDTLLPIDENLSSSHMDNVPGCTLPEPPDFEPHLTLRLFLDHQNLLVDGAHCTEGPSPPPPMKTFRGVYDPSLTVGSLGPALEPPSYTFTNNQVRIYASCDNLLLMSLHSTNPPEVHLHHNSLIEATNHILSPSHRSRLAALEPTSHQKVTA